MKDIRGEAAAQRPMCCLHSVTQHQRDARRSALLALPPEPKPDMSTTPPRPSSVPQRHGFAVDGLKRRSAVERSWSDSPKCTHRTSWGQHASCSVLWVPPATNPCLAHSRSGHSSSQRTAETLLACNDTTNVPPVSHSQAAITLSTRSHACTCTPWRLPLLRLLLPLRLPAQQLPQSVLVPPAQQHHDAAARPAARRPARRHLLQPRHKVLLTCHLPRGNRASW